MQVKALPKSGVPFPMHMIFVTSKSDTYPIKLVTVDR